MTEIIPQSDGPLTPEQEIIVSALTSDDLVWIDNQLLSQASDRRRKVAAIVGFAMNDALKKYPNVPDIFYAQRVKKLVESGALESFGNLDCMRFSEVRIPEADSN